jgi:hypothetical protein
MSDDDANPSEQFKDGFNRFWQLFECPERTLIVFVLVIRFDCFIFMAGTPSPKRKIRISDDH